MRLVQFQGHVFDLDKMVMVTPITNLNYSSQFEWWVEGCSEPFVCEDSLPDDKERRSIRLQVRWNTLITAWRDFAWWDVHESLVSIRDLDNEGH